MTDLLHNVLLVAVIAAVTALLRFMPFWLFSKNTPKTVLYLGKTLPCAIIAMLVVYCLKNISFTSFPFGAAELVSIAVVVVLHKLKHNTLLSILCGTVSYMLLVQLVIPE